MREIQCWSNLYLIISKLKGLHFQLKRRLQGQKVTKQLNVTKLKNTETVNDLQSAMNRKLSNLPTLSDDIEEAWASFRDTVHSIALKVLGPTTRKHRDWFEGNDAVIQIMYYWRKSATYFEPTRASSSAKRKRLASPTCTARYRQSSSLCSTPGSVPKQMRFRAMQTGMIPSGFMMLLKLSTDLNILGLPPSLDLLELPCPLKRNRSWRDQLDTLTVFSTAPLQWTTQPLNAFHRFWWTWSGESAQENVHQGNLRIRHNLCWVVQGWWLCPAWPDHPPLLVLLGQRATPSKVLEL